jgi:DNA-binding YbaB/EbfC family protein|tara:strand:+ start:1248 stop:1550 length:303 start_codon:yes stop_codon:yes gene_type:complete
MFNNAMMKQAKKMQEKMKEAQEEIAKMETQGSSGGVNVRMMGGKTIEEVSVSENLFEQKEKGLLEKFIREAVNDATSKADKIAQKKLKNVTGGIKIPGLF